MNVHTKFIFRTLLVTLLVIGAGSVRSVAGLKAQDTIRFGSTGFSGMPDSVQTGTQTLVGAFLKNSLYSDSAYHDSVEVHGYLDTGAVNMVYFSFPKTYLSLVPGDSIFKIFPINFSDPNLGGYFRIGNNTIVIWPVCDDPNFLTGDSLIANVIVLPTGMGPEPIDNEVVRCFPVPASGPLYIVSMSPSIHPVSAVIRDMTGRVVDESHNMQIGIDTEPWPPGVYFIDVTFDNGTYRTYKVVRQ